jgi:hypothetical protein
VPVPAYPSIPVQYEIEYKFKDPQRQNDYEANVVTQFRPGILIGDTGKYVSFKRFYLLCKIFT